MLLSLLLFYLWNLARGLPRTKPLRIAKGVDLEVSSILAVCHEAPVPVLRLGSSRSAGRPHGETLCQRKLKFGL